MAEQNLLVVEDDAQTAQAIQRALAGLDLPVRRVADLHAAQAEIDRQRPDLIVLDRLLPEGDSLDWLTQLRAAAPGAMVLILSALGQASSRIEGLDQGADDYLAKPFEPAELTARVRALLRRTEAVHSDEVLTFGALQIRVQARTVHVSDTHVPLSPREFDLLVFFARNHGDTVTRMQLLEHVWKLHFDPQTNVVDVHVGRLRRKLEAALGHSAIRTERGQGYVFAPDPDGQN